MPGGFGFFGAGAGPAGPPDPAPAPTPVTLVSSWAIDPETQRYQLDADGNPLPMDGTEQRVYFAVCGAETAIDVITPQNLHRQASALRAALRPLVADGSISGLRVDVVDDGRAATLKTITYTNARTNRAVVLRIR